ncbi:pilus assembly protein PilM [Candidatus Gracilibacteria bacterium]|nr:pilus assembly protein PilM [Candidatus Gracilibacteria bacterium]MCF7898370.1 pilus assembly protein PilM [Candidatus Paceibacterota bacterium]
MARNIKDMIVGIDIGSGSLRAIGAVRDTDVRHPVVLATYKKAIDGIERGNIVNSEEVTNAIMDAVDALEAESGHDTLHTLISLGAIGLSSNHVNGQTQVSRGDASVTDLDIENAIHEAHKGVPDIRNKAIVHTIPMKYRLDGSDVPGNIIGVRGNKLEVKTLFITYPLQCMNMLKKSLDSAKIRVTDIVAGPVAESIPLLTKKQKIAGVALINIGAEVTSILVYENNVPLLVSTLGVGGNDMTKDIALGMKITLEDAEEIKCGRSTLPHSKRRLEEILDARLEDICTKITKEFSRIQRQELLPAGIVVCGSSSQVMRLEYVFRNELKLPIKIISNELAKLTHDTLRDGGWARCYGLTFLAPQDTENDVLKELLTSFFIRVKKMITQFLP